MVRGVFYQQQGERFNENYEKNGTRSSDIVSRSFETEIREGRDFGKNGTYDLLDVTHLDKEKIIESTHRFGHIGSL